MIKNPKIAEIGDFVYSFYHQANVMVLGITPEEGRGRDYRARRLSTAGYGAPYDYFGTFHASMPTIYHKCVRPNTWANVGEI